MFDAGQKITRNILQQARGQFYNLTSVRPYKGESQAVISSQKG